MLKAIWIGRRNRSPAESSIPKCRMHLNVMWKTDLKTKEARETSLIAKLNNQTEVIISLEQSTTPLCLIQTLQYKSITGQWKIPSPLDKFLNFLIHQNTMHESNIDRWGNTAKKMLVNFTEIRWWGHLQDTNNAVWISQVHVKYYGYHVSQKCYSLLPYYVN